MSKYQGWAWSPEPDPSKFENDGRSWQVKPDAQLTPDEQRKLNQGLCLVQSCIVRQSVKGVFCINHTPQVIEVPLPAWVKRAQQLTNEIKFLEGQIPELERQLAACRSELAALELEHDDREVVVGGEA